MRRQVKEIIADERDYEIGGRAALLTIQIYAWIATISMLIMYSLRDLNPAYEPVAMTLAYSTCLLMIAYGLIFKFKSRAKFSQSKNGFIIFVIILAILGAIFTLRLFSGEDNWICKDGKWIEHGHPSFSAPVSVCK
jgi:glucan phosphoethanolaminetransferase (alkaline phosphatase superfamily)